MNDDFDSFTDDDAEAIAAIDSSTPVPVPLDPMLNLDFVEVDPNALDHDEIEVLAGIQPAHPHGVVVRKEEPGLKERDWDLSFGPVSGPAGKTATITVRPQCLFRGEKIMATDTGATPGQSTRIVQVAIGQKIQRAASGNGSLTAFFAQTALANGIRFDTAQRWCDIAVTISFINDCTFDMTVFGTAVVDE